jgi:hypothetical protein
VVTALDALRALLSEPGSEPLELTAALARARQALATDAATRWDLDRMELAFLRRQARRPDSGSELRGAVEAARLAEVRVETRVATARPDDDPAALFDLAEQRAVYRLASLHDDAAQALAEQQRRLGVIAPDDRCLSEARERFAALASGEEDLNLAHRIVLLEETAAVLAGLAKRTPARTAESASDTALNARNAMTPGQRQRQFRRLAARATRMRNDRVLVRRLEALLSPRGARWLEITSLCLLAVVFVLLALESWRPWQPATMRAFEIIDGSICLFFIAEFVFKLSLAPARMSWFVRHMLTDLLPAIPAALMLTPVNVPHRADDVVFVRLLRLMRVTYFARYLAAMQPVLRLFRLLLFLVKGMDGLVRRFSPLVNRNFVFFEQLALRDAHTGPLSVRDSLFRALRREHLLLAEAAPAAAGPVLLARAQSLAQRLVQTKPAVERPRHHRPLSRDVPVETAISALYGLRVPDLLQVLSLADVLAVDRVVRVLSAPVVRSLPIIRQFAVRQPHTDPAARVVAFAHRIALYLERWRARLVFFADLHGIVTGPQLLDRVATAMVKASQRPAVRLLLFGALFFLVRTIVGAESGPGQFLKRFVATPLVILGSVCAVFLSLGWWLKKIAGEASEAFKLTSEARFIGLLDSLKSRREYDDAAFLARRVFRDDVAVGPARDAILAAMSVVRRGRTAAEAPPVPVLLRNEVQQAGLLQLHYLDGALLHGSDVKTTEQLLANPSLENVRTNYLGTARKDRRRLRKLSLSDGSVFSGPYMWFSFITESAAVETAKRVTEYNRHCLTLAQLPFASAAERSEYEQWLHRRRLEMSGRTLKKLPPPGKGLTYRTTEFCALDFLSAAPERDAHIASVFGPDVAELLRADRQRMLREIFGMRPLHRLPPSQRAFNVYTFYEQRLSRGRILLLPAFFALAFLRGIGLVVGKTASTVREILRPQHAQRRRTTGRAPFTVALRKIHRMKAPGLLEAMRLRAAFDPEYCGAPATWSSGAVFDETSELTLDMRFLHLDERQRVELEARERAVRAHIEAWYRVDKNALQLPASADPLERRLRERALAVAWVTDRDRLRTLWTARAWLMEETARLAAPGARVPVSCWARACAWLLRRGEHPVDRVLRTHFADVRVDRHARRNLRRAYVAREARVVAWSKAGAGLPAGTDWQAEARARMQRIYVNQHEVTRDLCAVRAVQSLTVLDVRNYRELVFTLGGYQSDGEDPAPAVSLP